MSQTLATPPRDPARSKPRPRVLGWLSEKPETRSVQIGVAGTILIHLILLLFVPHLLRTDQTHMMAKARPRPRYNVTLAPNLFAKPKPKPPMRYVEANPNAPENTPEKTNNFSDRNQKVAQEKPTPNGKSDMPALEGRKNIQSNQIVTGQLTRTQKSEMQPAPAPPKPAVAQQQRRNPLAGFEKTEGADLSGTASNIGKVAENQRPVLDKVEGEKDGPLTSNMAVGNPQIDPLHPKPRRTLDQLHVRPAIFAENRYGTANVGVTALDSRWSNYGVYLKRLSEAVQQQWDDIIEKSGIYPQSGSVVNVTFVLNSKGGISKIVNVESSPGTSDFGAKACVGGISDPAPYGPWTEDMIAMLGTEQQLTFTFYYE